MFKFALFLVVAFCAVQGFQARAVQVDERDVDAIDRIMDIVYQFKNIFFNVASITSEIKLDAQNKLITILQTINLQGLVETFQKHIQMISDSGEDGRKCADDQSDEISAMINNAAATGPVCYEQIQGEMNNIENEMQRIYTLANNLINDVAARIRSCIANSDDIFGCLDDLVGPISDELASLQHNLVSAVDYSKQMANNGVNIFGTCAEKARDDFNANSDKIMGDIGQCIHGSNKF